jgi:hypothetical protein
MNGLDDHWAKLKPKGYGAKTDPSVRPIGYGAWDRNYFGTMLPQGAPKHYPFEISRARNTGEKHEEMELKLHVARILPGGSSSPRLTQVAVRFPPGMTPQQQSMSATQQQSRVPVIVTKTESVHSSSSSSTKLPQYQPQRQKTLLH